jgi:histidine ammonia-lyase
LENKMTLCVIDGKQCQCQPDEGVPCVAGTPAQVQAALNAEAMRLRAALELAAPALELGCDALRSEAERYHAEMAGYRPHRHQEADDAYKHADLARQDVVAALGPNVNSGTDHVA